MDFLTKLRSRLARRDEFLQHPRLRWLGARLNDPNLWHLGRRSVAGACGLGLFIAFVPVPIHMLLVPPLAIWLRVNLPVAISVIWVSNPVTMAPLLYLAYRIGCTLTGEVWVPGKITVEPTLASVVSLFHEIWLPLAVGALACGMMAGTLGYGLVQILWRVRVALRLRQRRLQRLNR